MYPGYIQALRTPETPWEPSKQAEGTHNNSCSVPQSLTQGDPESQPAQNHKRTLLALTHILGSLVPPHALWGTPWYHPAVLLFQGRSSLGTARLQWGQGVAGELLSVILSGQDDVMSPPDVDILARRGGCTVGSLWGGTTGEVYSAHCTC